MPGHVLVAFEYGSVNGGENSFLAVLDRLQQLGWKFSALVPTDTALSERLAAKEIPIVPFARADANGIRLTQAEIRANIVDAIRATRADLVHANSLAMSRLCGPVCCELNVPSLGYLRDIIKISRKAMDDINQLDRVVAVSEATRAFHLQRGLCSDRSITIHNGIDHNDFLQKSNNSRSVRTELGLPTDARLLLSCGQIGMRKGLDTLLLAFADLVKNQLPDTPPLHLLIVGERHSQKQEAIDYEQSLHATVGSKGLDDRVHFLGRRNDVAALMQQSTLLIHAARQEPLGRVLLEAAAVGLPIVATHVGGTREILASPTFDACLAPADDATGIADAARHLLEKKTQWNELSAELRRRAETRFSVTACADRLNEQYRQILSNEASGRQSS